MRVQNRYEGTRRRMKKLSSKEIKRIELGILKEFHRVCEEHGLSYLLAYGTALGAIRHQGFIPWDDDIDVFMPRADYERLYSLCTSSDVLASPYQLVSYRDQSSIYQFFKIVDQSTSAYETFVGKSHPIGLWIDIFPLEPVGGIADKTLAKVLRRQRRIGLLRSFAVADPNVGSSPVVIAAKRVLSPIARRFDLNRLAEKLDKNARAAGKTGTDERWYDIVGMCGPFDGNIMFPASKVRFEDDFFNGPAQPEAFLTQQYGDWKSVPPEDKRDIHFPEAYVVDEGTAQHGAI